MPIKIQAPDGSVAEFPDGTSDATIEAAMRMHYGGPESAAPPPTRGASASGGVEAFLERDAPPFEPTEAPPGPPPGSTPPPGRQPGAQDAQAVPDMMRPYGSDKETAMRQAVLNGVPFVGPLMAQLEGPGVRAFAQGVPVLGAYADEGNAAINAALAPTVEPWTQMPGWEALANLGVLPKYDERFALADKGDFKNRYDAALNYTKGIDDQAVKDRPGMYGAGALAGTVAALPYLGWLSARAAGSNLAVRTGAGLAEGGLWGAAQGYGSGEGAGFDPSRLEGAMKSGAFGAGVGAALPTVGNALGMAWQGGKEAVAGVRAPALAREATSGASEALGASPEQAIAAALIKPKAGAAAPAAGGNDAYARIAQAMARQKATPAELVEQTTALGPHGVLADTGEPMRDLARAAVNRPSGAADIAKKNLDPRQMGVLVDGEFTSRSSSQRILDEAAKGLGVEGKQFHQEIDGLLATRKATADPLYAKVREAPPVDIGELRDFAGTPDFRAAYGRAREISQREFVSLPDGSKQIVPLPEHFTSNEGVDWRTLDLMKQSLDDMVTEGATQGIGSNARGAIKSYRDAFRDKLDTLNPDYKAARAAYAGPSAMVEAMEDGRKLLREDAYVIGKRLKDMGESEQQMVRLGALQELKAKLGNTDVTYDAARTAGVLKPNQLERFKELFPDQAAFARFANTLGAEQTMFQTRSALFGNSTTARQLAAMKDEPDLAGQAVETAINVKTGGMAAVVRALAKISGPSPMKPATAEDIASILTNLDQGQLPRVARRLAEEQRRQALARAVGATARPAANANSGRRPD